MTETENFKVELLDNLESNILPYWADRMIDPSGGFYGRRDGNDNLCPDAPKGAILNARILWAFSAAYRLTRNDKYRVVAERAMRQIADKFYDKEYGGIYWSLDHNGNPLDTKKQFYAIGFAIYGLSEYARATGSSEALELAKALFHDIENHSRDKERGGYIEATTRDWKPIGDMRLSEKDANSSKTMNTHLHIIEPYTNLLRVWNSPDLRKATVDLLELFLDHIEDKSGSGHLGLFFDNDWNRQDKIISYGHDIEASWLLLETAHELCDETLLERTLRHTRKMADAAFEGRREDGSMIYESDADGHEDTDRHWWVQAENVVGQIYQYLFHGREDMLDNAIQSWGFIRDHIVDNDGGEWLWSVDDEYCPNHADDKAGFWKCPYHNSRMCIEVIERLS